MSDEDIIMMAREACEIAPRTDWNSTAWVLTDEGIKHFAELVAAREREECAKLCDPEPGIKYSPNTASTRKELAAAIRGR